MNKVIRTKIKDTLINWQQGDILAKQSYAPHGKRTHGYGHRSFEYGWILTIYKGDAQLASVSLPKQVYSSYIKAIVSALATEPTKCPHCNRLSFFYGKLYQPGKNRSMPYHFACERCKKPQHGDDDYIKYGQDGYFTCQSNISIQSRYYPDSVFYKG